MLFVEFFLVIAKVLEGTAFAVRTLRMAHPSTVVDKIMMGLRPKGFRYGFLQSHFHLFRRLAFGIFNNRQKLCFFIPQTFASSTLPVVITDGTDTIQLLTPCGNAVRADQLRSRRVYNANVATDTSIAIVRNALCCTAFVAPQITGVAAEAGA